MKDFRASEAVFICDECGDELKVIDSIYDEVKKFWELDLECRNCGPQGKDYISVDDDPI